MTTGHHWLPMFSLDLTRDAHIAVLALKNLVDSAEKKIRVAEREAVVSRLAVG